MTKSVPRTYTDDFKLEAVKLAEETGRVEAAHRLGIPESTLGHWLKASRNHKLFKNG